MLRRLNRFFLERVLPADGDEYYAARLSMKPSLPWMPYLHPALLVGSLLTLLFGDRNMIPPINGWDWVWLTAGITSPLVGFWSIWIMHHYTGRLRYRAFWMRLAANIGLLTAMSSYEVARFTVELVDPIEYHPLVDTVFLAAILFVSVVIWRDIKFLLVVERVAALIYKQARHEAITEHMGEDER